jgi:hypothetical protein
MVCTRLRMNLTRPHVDLTLLRMHLTRHRVHLKLMPETLPPTSFHPVLSCCSMGFFIALFISFVLLIFFIFIFLLFVGFYLPAMMWLDFKEEIVLVVILWLPFSSL